jgi:Fe-S-cluster-containing dehydrogenase component/DMSO reductase anchor subunit
LIRSALLQLAPSAGPVSALTPLERVLADQQRLTAVERFSKAHDAGLHAPGAAAPADGHRYRDLIPMERPADGQQYAFEVDLDLCTGCKACVTGCHNLNGLDDAEVWRTVGLLHGGSPVAPAQQTVTTACHHCLDPACLNGCPVKAYEKDPTTGIVKHLDDQCIGCQYCIFMCPYDAPKFSKQRGIVRKCDMCSDRLSNGEAPACVQSCPNEAIRITVVQRAEVVQAAESNAFLPGAPGPADTLPTTLYKTERVLPRNMLPANFYSVSPEHAHLPLVVMLTLTQLAVGAFGVNLLLGALFGGGAAAGGLGLTNALFALLLAAGALAASSAHLGRPLYAFRAVLGLRTSWLSREILTFSGFAGAAALYAGCLWLGRAQIAAPVGAAAGAFGAAGVLCSVMVYAATRRDHWRGSLTGLKFGLTAVILGTATVLMVSTVVALARGGAAAAFSATAAFAPLCAALAIASFIKLGFELSILRHLHDRHHSVLKRSAILMARDLGRVTGARFTCGALGGLALPVVAILVAAGRDPASAGFLAGATVAMFVLCLAGELGERYLFFAAAPSSKMPGGFG